MPTIIAEKPGVGGNSRKLTPFKAHITSPEPPRHSPSHRKENAGSHQQSESLLDEIFNGYEDFLSWQSN